MFASKDIPRCSPPSIRFSNHSMIDSISALSTLVIILVRILSTSSHLRYPLKQLAKKLSIEIKVHYQEPNRLQNVAIFVSREPQCLVRLLQAKEKGQIRANISVIIASDSTLKSL